ncbi:MAG TPA: SIMPL domain-containing protein [Candidatus Limnocylindrales bacterium]|nr:SIMPL domain-containing protein [Candidatus Limnocylindrales bacterium]
MSSTLRTLAAAAGGALIVAIVALTIRPAPVLGAPVTGTSDAPARTITVSANGSVTLVPDVAHVGLGISATKPTVEAARAEAARIMSAIVAAAKAKGVAERDIRTTGISLSPQYAPECGYVPTSSVCPKAASIVGYVMSEQVDVTIRDLDAAGGVIDAATAAGATNVNGISFQVDDPAKAEADARVAAIGAARAKAEAMARAAGVSIGAVVSITESSPSVPYPYPYAAGGAKADVATPVQPGTQDVQASVTVVYAIG